MQLVCPACGSQVPTEHINIHKMAAACPVCNTVFQFDTPEVGITTGFEKFSDYDYTLRSLIVNRE